MVVLGPAVHHSNVMAASLLGDSAASFIHKQYNQHIVRGRPSKLRAAVMRSSEFALSGNISFISTVNSGFVHFWAQQMEMWTFRSRWKHKRIHLCLYEFMGMSVPCYCVVLFHRPGIWPTHSGVVATCHIRFKMHVAFCLQLVVWTSCDGNSHHTLTFEPIKFVV